MTLQDFSVRWMYHYINEDFLKFPSLEGNNTSFYINLNMIDSTHARAAAKGYDNMTNNVYLYLAYQDKDNVITFMNLEKRDHTIVAYYTSIQNIAQASSVKLGFNFTIKEEDDQDINTYKITVQRRGKYFLVEQALDWGKVLEPIEINIRQPDQIFNLDHEHLYMEVQATGYQTHEFPYIEVETTSFTQSKVYHEIESMSYPSEGPTEISVFCYNFDAQHNLALNNSMEMTASDLSNNTTLTTSWQEHRVEVQELEPMLYGLIDDVVWSKTKVDTSGVNPIYCTIDRVSATTTFITHRYKDYVRYSGQRTPSYYINGRLTRSYSSSSLSWQTLKKIEANASSQSYEISTAGANLLYGGTQTVSPPGYPPVPPSHDAGVFRITDGTVVNYSEYHEKYNSAVRSETYIADPMSGSYSRRVTPSGYRKETWTEGYTQYGNWYCDHGNWLYVDYFYNGVEITSTSSWSTEPSISTYNEPGSSSVGIIPLYSEYVKQTYMYYIDSYKPKGTDNRIYTFPMTYRSYDWGRYTNYCALIGGDEDRNNNVSDVSHIILGSKFDLSDIVIDGQE